MRMSDRCALPWRVPLLNTPSVVLMLASSLVSTPVASAQFVDTTQAPPNLFTVTASTGYDGQFFYRLALTRSAAPTPPLASHSTTRATTTSASCIPCWRMLCRLAAHPWPSIR